MPFISFPSQANEQTKKQTKGLQITCNVHRYPVYRKPQSQQKYLRYIKVKTGQSIVVQAHDIILSDLQKYRKLDSNGLTNAQLEKK